MFKYFVIFHLLMVSNGMDLVNMTINQPCRSEALAEANRRFAFSLLDQIAAENSDGNIFIAPLVVNMGLSMVLEGSRGSTRDELVSALQLAPSSLDYRTDNLACIYEKYNEDARPKLTTVVKIFGDRSMNFTDAFEAKTSLYASNKLETVDFVDETEQSRTLINDWVSGKTAGRINELFPIGSLSMNTKLALASVLYFKGEWVNQFSRNFTSEFFVNSSHSVPVKMMHKEMKVRYYYDGNTQLYFVELPYKSTEGGVEVSMILILDEYRPGYAEAERQLTESNTENALNKLFNRTPATADIYLPMFNISASYDLRNPLQAMGIQSLFDPNSADLSGMTDIAQQSLHVSKAMHKTFLSVDNHGSEAAGAFGLTFVGLSLPAQFRFEKPFHLLIYEKESRNILFMGRILNPNL